MWRKIKGFMEDTFGIDPPKMKNVVRTGSKFKAEIDKAALWLKAMFTTSAINIKLKMAYTGKGGTHSASGWKGEGSKVITTSTCWAWTKRNFS